ncbi:ribose 5-phosphate isomerase [Corynespora cassiicola Philippines]|uniref:Ribose-5-phosphate isomerase n=1 Tax=Corynespora cassiicola Philippines TaxID=1448308 RepID=A0A2T2N9M0_CORCC|nr:ribose 5-phosphate isomerase [Corynespora cassiicola Philippines]
MHPSSRVPLRQLHNITQHIRHQRPRALSCSPLQLTPRCFPRPLNTKPASSPNPQRPLPTPITSTYTTTTAPRRNLSTSPPPFPTSKMADNTVIESAKRAAGRQAVADHFDPTATHVGIGSGTTIVYVVEAIKEASTNPHIRFVPTGYQSRQVIVQAGLTPLAFDSLPDDVVLDIAFDGADEVDEELNCIKGGGACLFQEKLVAERARKFVCVADYRKRQARLLTNWPTIPIEVAPIAVRTVQQSLKELGSTGPKLRTTLLEKSGPLKTDQDFFIVDAPFPTLLTSADVAAGKGKGDGSDGTWEVNQISRAIKSITGVLDVGIFSGVNGVEAEALRAKGEKTTAVGGQKPIAVYFGMQDGSVQVLKA